MRRCRRIRSFLLAGLLALGWFIAAPLSAQAAPAPIVFDFEDGLQGWELSGSTQRVQTQLLGGQWSILGDGLITDETTGLPLDVFISRDIDLTGIASVSVDQFFLAGDERGLVATPNFGGIDLIENIFVGTLGFGPFDASDPFTNPSLRTASMRSFEGMRLEGVHRVEIHWNIQPEVQRIPEELPAIVAFIDNITFHPVPEPSSWLSLGMGIAGVVMIHRKLASGA